MSEQDFQRVEEGARLDLPGARLPTTQTIRRQLREQLNSGVLAERNRRGEVTRPEDTWPMQRSLAKVVEVCGEYSRAFADAAKEACQVAEEELVEAVGEQDGMPNGGMVVPDAEGDVRIKLDTRNEYEIDQDALHSAVAFQVLATVSWRDELIDTIDRDAPGAETTEETETLLAGLLVVAMQRLVELGSFRPGVMKARQFVKELGRMPGADGVASSVASSIRKDTQYRGVKIERVQEK